MGALSSIAWTLLIGLLGSGCAGATGTFRANGFHHDSLPIVVHYRDASAHQFVGPDWQIDNFAVKDDGTIGKPKMSGKYVWDREIDYDDDGRADPELAVPIYDLRLVNRVTHAAMWLQSVPLRMPDKDRALKSILDDFVAWLSGTGFYLISPGPPKGVGVAKTYGARVVAMKENETQGFESLDATIEIVNLDQSKVDPNAKSSIERVVLVHTDYPQSKALLGGNRRHEARAMVILGCESDPRYFEATNADFPAFLGAVELGRPSR
jgi:hypothetical protein